MGEREKDGEKTLGIASDTGTFKGCSQTPPLRSLRMRLPIAAHCSTQVRLRPRSVVTGEEGTVQGHQGVQQSHCLQITVCDKKKFEPLKFPRFIRDNFLQRIFSTLILLAATEVERRERAYLCDGIYVISGHTRNGHHLQHFTSLYFTLRGSRDVLHRLEQKDNKLKNDKNCSASI